jgi:catechol 2,3-dioxygenase-like lactoylglutathione lyase family enzyme
VSERAIFEKNLTLANVHSMFFCVLQGKAMPVQYIMIGSNDLNRSRLYYDAVMPHIGGTLKFDYAGFTFCYDMGSGIAVWIATPHNKQPAVASNGSMPGFSCASKAAVDAAYAAALANGGSDEGPPGPRPQYSADFYGAYVRDPDGNKMAFVLTEDVLNA